MIYYKKHQVIAYADDIAIITRSIIELKKMFRSLENVSRRYGLHINEDKTKYLELLTGKETVAEKLDITSSDKNYSFQKVKNFEYLGVTMTHISDEDMEIDKRTMKASRALGALENMIKSKLISRKTKIRLYKTIIQPTLLYGSETWVLNKKNKSKLERWERKILRKIYGGIQDEGQWRRRTNKEIQEMYKTPCITSKIQAQRLRWLGHVVRMGGERIAKKVLLGGEGGKKKRGRPRKKWMDAVKEDLRQIGIEDWTRSARDRIKWRNIIRQINALYV